VTIHVSSATQLCQLILIANILEPSLRKSVLVAFLVGRRTELLVDQSRNSSKRRPNQQLKPSKLHVIQSWR